MKRIIITLPALILLIAACTKSVPPPRITWRRSARVAPAGPTIAILPPDVRVAFTYKASSKKREAVWTAASEGTEAMKEALPDFLKRYHFTVNNMVTWNGTVIDPKGYGEHLLSEQEMARAISSLAYFAKSPNTTPLKHLVAPTVLKKLSAKSDLSLYITSWYTVARDPSETGNKILKGVVVVIGMVLVILVVAAFAAALSGGKSGGKSKGSKSLRRGSRSRSRGGSSSMRMGSRKGSRRFHSRWGTGTRRRSRIHSKAGISRSVTRGLNHRISRNRSRASLRHARLMRRSPRFALRLVRSLLNIHAEINAQGMTVYSLPNPISPLFSDELTGAQLENSNRYLGVLDGVSALAPLFTKEGQYISYVLINNHTGAVVWDAQIFIPQGTKELKFEKVLHHLFSSIPKAVVKRIVTPPVKRPGPGPAKPVTPTPPPVTYPTVKNPVPVTLSL